jgi:organic radical activating enzyme
MQTIKRCGNPVIDNIYFDWHLTDWCNFKCSYCPVLDVITNDFTVDKHASYEMVLARLAHVETSFNVCLTGGEPTLHPNILDILDKLVKIKNSQDIALFTNLSRPANFYTKIVPSDKITVFASYHPEFSTEKFFDRCLEVNNLSTTKFSVHVSLSDKEEYWDQTLTLLDSLEANNVRFKPLLLSPNRNYTPNYTDDFYKKFHHYLVENIDDKFFHLVDVEYEDGTTDKIKNIDFQINSLNKFKGYACTPLSYSIDVKGRIENTCTRRKVPLYLNNNNLIVKETCPMDICPSNRLLKFYKEKQ